MQKFHKRTFQQYQNKDKVFSVIPADDTVKACYTVHVQAGVQESLVRDNKDLPKTTNINDRQPTPDVNANERQQRFMKDNRG